MPYVENMTFEGVSESFAEAWKLESDPLRLWQATELLRSSPQEAIAELVVLAEGGSILSMFYLGDTYLFGHGIDKNEEKGLYWYHKSSSVGSIDGTFELARYYNLVENYTACMKELKKIARRGYGPSLYEIGRMYYYGKGVKKNKNKAMACWKISGSKGHFFGSQFYSYILRKGDYGFFNRIFGFYIFSSILIPFIKCKISYPTSDRIRKF